MERDAALLEVEDIYTYFFTREGVLKAVNGVSFSLRPDSVLGLVGESGSGKTVTALSILRLVPYPGRIVRGQVRFQGRDLLALNDEALREVRGKEIAMVFQDPLTSLNPVIPVGSQVEELLTSHLALSRGEARRRSLEALHHVGLADPERVSQRHPFQLSGGMAQRVMLAMAMVLNPKVLIADEPTSALDVTLQADILQELRRLQQERHSAILLITHDLGVIAQMAEEVIVMYAGSVMEQADTITLFHQPAHPYTWALLRAIPRWDSPRASLRPIGGAPPNLLNLPDRCPFIPRCHKARNECRSSPRPPLKLHGPNHWLACYNPVRYDF